MIPKSEVVITTKTPRTQRSVLAQPEKQTAETRRRREKMFRTQIHAEQADVGLTTRKLS